MLQTPILITAFNRPQQTLEVFEAVRQVKPKQLFVCIDGPREGKENEKQKVLQTQAIFKNIDWDCELKTLFQDKNLGCKRNVSGGIDWFFDHVEYGIILEDDCVPSQNFFFFCQDLLEKYKDNSEIFMIGGNNMLSAKTKDFKNSYFFTPFPFIWGWATWRRAWVKRDLEISDYDDFIKNNNIDHLHISNLSKKYLINKFIAVKDRKLDSWAYGWFYTILQNQALSILFSLNLTENIGFGDDSTHTKGNLHHHTPIDIVSNTNLIHPEKITASNDLDQSFFYIAQKNKSELLANQFLPKWVIKLLQKILNHK